MTTEKYMRASTLRKKHLALSRCNINRREAMLAGNIGTYLFWTHKMNRLLEGRK